MINSAYDHIKYPNYDLIGDFTEKIIKWVATWIVLTLLSPIIAMKMNLVFIVSTTI